MPALEGGSGQGEQAGGGGEWSAGLVIGSIKLVMSTLQGDEINVLQFVVCLKGNSSDSSTALHGGNSDPPKLDQLWAAREEKGERAFYSLINLSLLWCAQAPQTVLGGSEAGLGGRQCWGRDKAMLGETICSCWR